MKTIYKIIYRPLDVALFKSVDTSQIEKAFVKKSGFIKLKLQKPELDYDIEKEKNLEHENIKIASKTVPKRLYVASVNHSEKCIYMFPVSSLYKFEQLLSKENNQPINKLDQRIYKKEELEYMNKNVNYLLKQLSLEEEFVMNYDEDFDLLSKLKTTEIYEEIHETKKNYNEDDIIKRIVSCVKRTRIVNYSVLLELFAEENIIKNILVDMCIPMQGRYILKSKFYSKSLWSSRKYILDHFSMNKQITYEEIEKTNQREDVIFLVKELCYYKDGVYHMKGMVEEYIERSDKPDLGALIFQKDILSLNAIVRLCEIETDECLSELEQYKSKEYTIYQLYNHTYVSDNGLNIYSKHIFEFFGKKDSCKRNEIIEYFKDKLQTEINIIDLSAQMKKYCKIKSGVWHLKDGTNT